MPRSIDLTAQSPHSLAQIRSAFADEAYWQFRLTAFEVGTPALTHLISDPAGTTSVAMTTRFGADQLPDALRRLRLPSLELVQTERWFPGDDDTLRGDIVIDAPRTPLSGDGSVVISPAGSGTTLAGTATVKVNVPVIGGRISAFIADILAQGIVDIVRVTDTWLASNAEPGQ